MAMDENWGKGEYGWGNSSVQSASTNHNNTSKLWHQQDLRNEEKKATSFSGEVSTGGKFAGLSQGHTAQQDYALWSSLMWRKDEGGSVHDACSVPQITALVPEPRKKKHKKTWGRMGKGSLKLSVNSVQISSTVLKPPPFFWRCPTFLYKTNICTSLTKEQPFP